MSTLHEWESNRHLGFRTECSAVSGEFLAFLTHHGQGREKKRCPIQRDSFGDSF